MQNTDSELTGYYGYTILLTSSNLLSSLMDTCENFLITQALVKKGEFFATNLGENIPYLIATWIMNM